MLGGILKFSLGGSWLPVLYRNPGTSPRRRKGKGQPVVALSIDDGPTTSTPALLDLLARFDARATFFISGVRAAAAPALAAEVIERGHDVYAHGYHHAPLDEADADDLVLEMAKGEAVLTNMRPTPSPYLVRLPFAAGRHTPWVHRALRRWRPDCQIAHWSVSLDDQLIATRCGSLDEVRAACRRASERAAALPDLDGGIIMLHDQPFWVDSPYSGPVTVTIVATLLDALTEKGYRVVAIRSAQASALSRFWLRMR